MGNLRVCNPATGELVAELPCQGANEASQAIERAARSLTRPTTIEQRSQWLQGITALLLERREELARTITLEQGKPLAEARTEVDYTASFFHFFAGELHRLKSEKLPAPIHDLRWTVHHRPAGVVALITPWNFPMAMLAKKLAAALGAGCGIVVKPSEQTPLSALNLAQICEEAGVPPGQVNLVCGAAEEIGRVFCEHPAVRVISFTGSTKTGQWLLAASAPHVKRLSLELGGNAPFIVFEDADLEAAADALMVNKFRCAGQTCVCANRIYVASEVIVRFADLVSERVGKLRVGNGLEPRIQIGPLINRAAFEKVLHHCEDAMERGARLVCGSLPDLPATEWGNFFPPLILTGVRSEMLLMREETFGPVVPLAEFTTEEEVLAAANGTPYGLAAYVFTSDAARAKRCAQQLHFGHVALNSGAGPIAEAPFGGMKFSGFGREGGAEGLLEYCETQTVGNPG